MSSYQATVVWKRNGADFLNNQYSRGHAWRFDGGIEVAASASPQVVPVPLSLENAVDPEEAFIASLSSCHMLWFLSLASRRGFIVDSYEDKATGVLARNNEGRMAMAEVILRPAIVFSGENKPGPDDITSLHESAHENCFIANSVTTTVRCEPQL